MKGCKGYMIVQKGGRFWGQGWGRESGRFWGQDTGSSIIEIMLALLVFAIAALPLARGIAQGAASSVLINQREMARRYAEEGLEMARTYGLNHIDPDDYPYGPNKLNLSRLRAADSPGLVRGLLVQALVKATEIDGEGVEISPLGTSKLGLNQDFHRMVRAKKNGPNSWEIMVRVIPPSVEIYGGTVEIATIISTMGR